MNDSAFLGACEARGDGVTFDDHVEKRVLDGAIRLGGG
jgi:hypothetical protein